MTNKLLRYFPRCLFLIIVQIAFIQQASAQTVTSYSPTKGSTPVGLAPGSPVGSYALSGFDTLNPYNFSLNFRLPLLQVGGRGAAGYTMMLPIQRRWRVNKTVTDSRIGCEACEEHIVTYSISPNGDWWHPEIAEFGPGMMAARYSGNNLITGCFSNTRHWQYALTRLTFTAADGTEYEFRDKDHNGVPLETPSCNQGASRGRVFITADGSAATFISDAPIFDATIPVSADSYFLVSGYLLLRDGTRYRIDEGKVSWIRDRNGNLTRFEPGTIIDPLNRQISFSYEYTPIGLIAAKQINFKGFKGASRTIRIVYDDLQNCLLPANGQHPAETIKTFAQLFPAISDWGENSNAADEFHAQVISRVDIPNGKSYRFFYNSYGELARVELPTGGAFEYDWSGGVENMGGSFDTGPNYEIYREVHQKRTYKGENGETLDGRMILGGCTADVTGNSCRQVDHVDPNNNNQLLARTKHFYYGVAGPVGLFKDEIHYPKWNEGREYKTELFDKNGTTVLDRTETNWLQRAAVPWWVSNSTLLGPEPENDPRVASVITTLPQVNKALRREIYYDDTLPFNNPADVYEYDFGTPPAVGPLLRRTHTEYVTAANYVGTDGLAVYAGSAAHLRSLPSSQWISSDAAGVSKRSFSSYEYDSYIHDSIHEFLLPREDITGLCTTFNSSGICANTAPQDYYTRGNPTSVTSYVEASNQTGPVTVSMQYDVAGNLVRFLDTWSIARQLYYATTIDYSDRFGIPDDNEARNNAVPAELTGTPNKQTYAFPTLTTNPLGHKTYSQLDYYLGKPVNAENENGVIASGYYNDSLDRPKKVIQAVGTTAAKQTIFEYNDTARLVTATRDLRINGDGVLVSQSLYDSLGRTVEARQYEEGTNFIATKTEYDSLGQPAKVSNPFRQGETPKWTITTFDGLGRVKTVTSPDNSVMTTSYLGNEVTVTDQAGKARKSIGDALGRLTSVYEDPSALNYQTSYEYDALNNLKKVIQGLQTRTFVYDSLSRLTTATNPESGTVNYEYYENGNLKTKTDPRLLPNTSTHRTIQYDYDELGRLKTRTYNDGTPNVTFAYDATNVAFSKGRLTQVSSSVSQYSYGEFDPLGRVKSATQTTDSQAYTMSYDYNAAGALTAVTYPSGRVVTTNYDNAARIAGVRNSATGLYYAGSDSTDTANRLQYSSFGAVEAMKLGNGLWEHTNFNSRLQIEQIGLGSTKTNSTVLQLDYGYGTTNNNGNVRTQTLTLPGSVILAQSYDYDPLNRLESAKEMNGTDVIWKQSFTYLDQNGQNGQYGNRRIDTDPAKTTPALISENPLFDPATNRIQPQPGEQYEYDVVGNLTKDKTGHTFTYDAENRLTAYDGGNPANGGASFVYDGEGRRVKKLSNAGTTIFVYSVTGQLIAEYGNSQSGGSGTTYITTDTLGTARVITNSAGNVIGRHDYLPFGGEIAASFGGRLSIPGYNATDALRQKFAGKERDVETNLDYLLARYYSSLQGRFTSPDEFKGGPSDIFILGSGDPETQALVYADVANPQSLNKYQYAYNNPLRYVDPNGQNPQDGHELRLRRDEKALLDGKMTAEEFAARRKAEGVGAIIGLSAVVTVVYGPAAFEAILIWAARNPDKAQRLAEELNQASTQNPLTINFPTGGSLTLLPKSLLSNAEKASATRLILQEGLDIAETPSVSEEVVIKTGQLAGKFIDFMGEPAAFAANAWGVGKKAGRDFFKSILRHARKDADITYIDLNGASPEQIQAIKDYVSTLTKELQAKIKYIN